MTLQFIAPKYCTVVLEVFDGTQYGMLPLCVEAFSHEEAEKEAVKQATEDGWQKVKVQFIL